MQQGPARHTEPAPLLPAKSRAEYRLLPARGILNRCAAGSLMPFHWTINPYRGCEFACRYCYARYTHEFLELDGRAFERLVFVKQFRKDMFERELRAVRPGEWIAIGAATDPYQPAERRFGVTRALLEVLANQAGLSVALTTKSCLVVRDAPLLARLALRNRLRVNFTITTLDARLARILEPGAPRPDLRLRALARLAGAGIDTAVFASPVMPAVNDGGGRLEALARAARQAGANHFGAQMLFLRGAARGVFLEMLDREFPALAARYRRLFARGSRLDPRLRGALALRIARIREDLGFPSSPPSAPAWGQMSLFAALAPSGDPPASPLHGLRPTVAGALSTASAV